MLEEGREERKRGERGWERRGERFSLIDEGTLERWALESKDLTGYHVTITATRGYRFRDLGAVVRDEGPRERR
jgi:hypothetical protein